MGKKNKRDLKKKDICFYDKGDDSLTFINKNRNAKHTVNTGLILLSLNPKKQIEGIQLMGANKNFKIEKNVLENLTRGMVKFDYHKNQKALIITISLYYKEKKPLLIVNNLHIHNLNDHIQSLNAVPATSCA